MTRARSLYARRGVAAVEFALVCPVLLMCAGGVADFGLALADRSQMASAVAQAAQYGYLNPSTATASNIGAQVTAGASLPGMTATVTNPAYFCMVATSTPPVLSTATATTTCADGTSAGYYVTISASYLYPPLMPAYSGLVNTTLTESITVRIQ